MCIRHVSHHGARSAGELVIDKTEGTQPLFCRIVTSYIAGMAGRRQVELLSFEHADINSIFVRVPQDTDDIGLYMFHAEV